MAVNFVKATMIREGCGWWWRGVGSNFFVLGGILYISYNSRHPSQCTVRGIDGG